VSYSAGGSFVKRPGSITGQKKLHVILNKWQAFLSLMPVLMIFPALLAAADGMRRDEIRLPLAA